MFFPSMRDMLNFLEAEGDVKRIKQEVDGEADVGAIMWELYNRRGSQAPVVIFENVKGRGMPLVKNVYGSLARWALAAGMEDWRGQHRYKEIRERIMPLTGEQSKWIDPIIVKDAPCKEVVLKGEDADLGLLPVFRWHPTDGGPYITLPGCVLKDPEWGHNFGMYRMMIHDRSTTGFVANAAQDGGIFAARAKQRGRKTMDLAVAIGFDPALYLAAVMKMPEVGRDCEFRFVGSLTGRPVELVRCETIDMEVPASSEIVLEGQVHLEASRLEGPFGEFTGYAGEQMNQPTFKLRCITMRRHPSYVSTTSAHYASECLALHYPQPTAWYNKMKSEIVGFRDAFFPMAGRMLVVVIQIKKRYPGWGKQALLTALGSGFGMSILNQAIVVDEDVDIYSLEEVMWAVSTRCDPELDVIILPPVAVNALNPAARARLPKGPELGYTDFNLCSKMGIDATKKFASEAGRSRATPETSRPGDKDLERIRGIWSQFGLD